MVTATASSWSGVTPADASAASTQPSMAASCASCASLGTTPPQAAWMSACVARLSPSTRPLVLTTATPVSSQLLSMPSTRPEGWRGGGGGTPEAAAAAAAVLPPRMPAVVRVLAREAARARSVHSMPGLTTTRSCMLQNGLPGPCVVPVGV